MATVKFFATIGVVAGYGHENEVAKPADTIVAEAWQKAAAAVFADTGIYVSAVVEPSRVVYHTDWGCPVGGEVAATASGTANPAFIQDLADWKKAVLSVIKLIKSELQQSTVAVEFVTVDDFVYLTD